MIKENKVIVIDIDGTLTLGIKNDESYDTVRVSELLKQRLIDLKAKEYWIILYTSRNMRTHGGNIGQIMKHTAPTLINWLAVNDVPYDELHFGKPWCGHDGFYVDDRAIRPKEFVEKTMEELHSLIVQDQLKS
jgi:capsule biosynthesis phosphatase